MTQNKDKDTCEIFCVDEQKVRSVAKYLNANNNTNHLAEIFKVLGSKSSWL